MLTSELITYQNQITFHKLDNQLASLQLVYIGFTTILYQPQSAQCKSANTTSINNSNLFHVFWCLAFFSGKEKTQRNYVKMINFDFLFVFENLSCHKITIKNNFMLLLFLLTSGLCQLDLEFATFLSLLKQAERSLKFCSDDLSWLFFLFPIFALHGQTKFNWRSQKKLWSCINPACGQLSLLFLG